MWNITYIVEGSAAEVEISYYSGTTIVAAGSVGLPWSVSLSVPVGSELAITARNLDESGALSCRITASSQSEALADDRSEDAYGSVTCTYPNA